MLHEEEEKKRKDEIEELNMYIGYAWRLHLHIVSGQDGGGGGLRA